MNLSRGWLIFFFIVNLFFVLMWTQDLAWNAALLLKHSQYANKTRMLIDLAFSVVNIFFATHYQRALWPKRT